VRWIACLVGLCLLFAGATPRRAAHDTDRPDTEIAAVKALAKLAVRRHDGARPMRLGLESFAPVSTDPALEPPRACVEIVHAFPEIRCAATSSTCDARGPPVG
jgi:hypothetical protein